MSFDDMIKAHQERMEVLRIAQSKHPKGCLRATSIRNSGYSIFLSPGIGGESAWRVTSFHCGEPIGHRCYDHLECGSHLNSALYEFASEDWAIAPPIPATQRGSSALS